jgi:hypothetical protein
VINVTDRTNINTPQTSYKNDGLKISRNFAFSGFNDRSRSHF